MSLFADLYNSRATIDFRPLWKHSLRVSLVVFVVSLILLFTRGLDLSVDFDGGGVFEAPVAEGIGVDEARDALGAVGLTDARVQAVTGENGESFVRVQTGVDDLDRRTEIVEVLAELGDGSTDDIVSETVGPTWGDEITRSARNALGVFFVIVSMYLAWRLEWRMAVGALVAVAHDLVITAGVYALFGFEVAPATVIALLTILGYSLYDTVVVYDKVLENTEPAPPPTSGRGKKAAPVAEAPAELVNRSMNQVVMRSINTTITTVIPVLSMLIIGSVFLGGVNLREFALALFIGLLLGTYSSLFVAAPVLVWLRNRYEIDHSEKELSAEDAALAEINRVSPLGKQRR